MQRLLGISGPAGLLFSSGWVSFWWIVATWLWLRMAFDEISEFNQHGREGTEILKWCNKHSNQRMLKLWKDNHRDTWCLLPEEMLNISARCFDLGCPCDIHTLDAQFSGRSNFGCSRSLHIRTLIFWGAAFLAGHCCYHPVVPLPKKKWRQPLYRDHQVEDAGDWTLPPNEISEHRSDAGII